MYMYTYVRVHVHVYVNMYVHYMYMYVCIYVQGVCIIIHVCMYMCMYTCICVYCTYMYTCNIILYIHTVTCYNYTYIHVSNVTVKEVVFTVVLAVLVCVMAGLLLSIQFYRDFWVFWFCFVVGTAHFSLIKVCNCNCDLPPLTKVTWL